MARSFSQYIFHHIISRDLIPSVLDCESSILRGQWKTLHLPIKRSRFLADIMLAEACLYIVAQSIVILYAQTRSRT
ncbi:hypothetical protein BT63DRAFT_305979 [Microthyrium microscopicum]|uniref:Uncharacterized protein n=1 Tax=Microthyrium microscopicum TaxID=703497 RepID=A0A6A6U8M1_9PEZI|nr:hypothetical protein BT63DRAFT_305979 [Microthyrium microscopicum]